MKLENLALCHFGFVVKNMERSIKIWEAQGAKLIIEPTVDPIQKVSCALIQTEGSVPIELVAPVAGMSGPLSSRLARGGGLDHVCYFVESIADARQAFEKRGQHVIVEPAYGCVFDRNIVFTVNAAGLISEFMEINPLGRVPDPLRDCIDSLLKIGD